MCRGVEPAALGEGDDGRIDDAEGKVVVLVRGRRGDFHRIVTFRSQAAGRPARGCRV
jgi:hypothetical protein